jgi:hypothetical protein
MRATALANIGFKAIGDRRDVEGASVLAVYSGVSKPIRTWLCAARL